MARFFKLAVITILVAVSAVRGGGQMQPQVDSALVRLEKVSIFAMGPVGFAGVTSQGQKDLRVILQQPDSEALKLLEDLYLRGNSAGKAYALWGIHQLHPARFQVLAAELSRSEMPVRRMSGCIGYSEKLKMVVQQIGEAKN